MINNIAYVKDVEVNLEKAGKYHDIRCKDVLGLPLNDYERSYYLLFVASIEEARKYLKDEKNGNNKK